MKKRRIFWIVLGCIALLGLGMAATGWAMGASLCMYVDASGIHVLSEDTDRTPVAEELSEIRAVDASTASADLRFVESDRYKIEIIDSYGRNTLHWRMDGTTLHIENDGGNGAFLNFDLRFLRDKTDYSTRVTVYYPAGAVFDELKAHTASGKIDIQTLTATRAELRTTSGDISLQALTADQAELKTTSGRITARDSNLSDLSARATSGNITLQSCTADRATLSTVSGKATLTGFSAGEFHCQSTSGNILLSGELRGESDIRSTSGRVELKLTGRGNDYQKRLRCTSGRITYNGEQAGETLLDNDAAPYRLEIETTSGDINVSFTE